MKLSVQTIGRGLVISSLLISFSAVGADISQSDLEQVERQVRQQTQEQKRLEREAEKAGQELKKVNQEMIKAAKIIQSNEESLSQMEERLKTLETDYEATKNKLLDQNRNLVQTLSALQSLALKPTEALFVQPLAPVDIVRSAMLLRETVPYLEAQAEIIKQELEVLGSKREVIRRQVKKILEKQGQLERQQAQMKVLAETKSKYREKVSKQSLETRKNVAKLAGQAQDLRDLLAKLEAEKEAKRRKMAEEAKKKVLETRKSEQPSTADLIKFDTEIINETGTNFIKAKGAISRPVRGPITVRYGQETAKGVSSKGISIQTRGLAQVIAPFDGSVLFAGPFRGYGNLIIIEHGKGYTSLLAGLDSIDCETGQMLLAGEPVGQMPTGANAKLYMELRKDNQPINPESWLEK